MSGATHKKIELVGTSTESIEDAIQGAIAKASQSINNLEWFEVQEVRGAIRDGGVKEYQVVLKAGFMIK